jgi:UDP-glucose:(heptosyl)LPS alpha-1,3-glucosyltransferase
LIIPVKIAVVIPKYGLVGGGEKFALELTERIARSFPCEMHVFANRWQRHSDRIRFHKVPLISFPKHLTTVSFAWFAKRCMERIGFDLIHAHDRVFDADIVSLHSIPHRLWVRDVRKKRFPSLFDRATVAVERAMVLNNDRALFLPVSGIARDRFVAEFPHCAGRVEILHPGVDMAGFDRLDRTRCRENIRRQFGFQENDAVLLFVGMNFELKGLDPLIAALGRIKSMSTPAPLKLLVVGKGNQNRYRKMARDAGVGEDVCFAGVRTEAMEEVYLAADFYAMLSAFDTFGMTVLEAMAAALPVLVTPNVGARDLVQDGVNGYIVDREDIDAVSRSILMLLDPDRRAALGANARQVAQHHGWDAMAQRVMVLYERILAGKRDGQEGPSRKDNH